MSVGGLQKHEKTQHALKKLQNSQPVNCGHHMEEEDNVALYAVPAGKTSLPSFCLSDSFNFISYYSYWSKHTHSHTRVHTHTRTHTCTVHTHMHTCSHTHAHTHWGDRWVNWYVASRLHIHSRTRVWILPGAPKTQWVFLSKKCCADSLLSVTKRPAIKRPATKRPSVQSL